MMLFSQPADTDFTRHYYSKDKKKLFEKSLDIYKPRTTSTTNTSSKLPIVILVVGSAWVGHRAWVYLLTSWWNSSGPKTIARLGTTCVCIRHRGALWVVPAPPVLASHLALVLAVVGAITGGQWDLALGVTAVLAALATLLALAGQGSARLEDMLEDVTEALAWIHQHRDLLEMERTTDTYTVKGATTNNSQRTSTATAVPYDTSTSLSSESTADQDGLENPNNVTPQSNPSSPTPLVFGGYSSGGHVAMTLVQQPERFRNHGLPTPDKLFQGILVISGMMAVRPEKITIQQDSHKTGSQPLVIATLSPRPRWCTDLVLAIVWGAEAAKTIPSPLAGPPPPALPHLLVGCRHELFGLNWLDIYFCSAAYRDKVEALTGQVAKYVEVESDHWFILSSAGLRNVLQEELPKLVI